MRTQRWAAPTADPSKHEARLHRTEYCCGWRCGVVNSGSGRQSATPRQREAALHPQASTSCATWWRRSTRPTSMPWMSLCRSRRRRWTTCSGGSSRARSMGTTSDCAQASPDYVEQPDYLEYLCERTHTTDTTIHAHTVTHTHVHSHTHTHTHMHMHMHTYTHTHMPAHSLTSELPHALAVALLHAHVLRHLAADDWQPVHMNTIRGYDAAMHDKRWCAQVHEQPLQDSTIECPVGPIVARGVSRVCAWRYRGSSDTGSSGVSSANGPWWS